ncbi:PPA1309 family protein [Jiangella mangrovi]|uniref:Uncharacterized protein n=1 Tax=Jiangella mangrovi TaxID=1524084 RepID=A0A7W9GLC9_9ACTN|nr:PPA1309 family protein [Jiangella mangrovi]MBB5785806.1 hypothetical protein [Jiangella mangrovi]
MSSNDQPNALVRAIAEIEQHVRGDGWDQPARLYALASTNDLLTREPDLAARIGIEADSPADSLTPIEQDVAGRPIEDLLVEITWPDTVAGCALVLERIVLPPGAEEQMPDDDGAAASWAQQHPDRSDVRVVVGVMRDGTRASVLRIRGHEADDELIRGAELSPELGNALAETFS